MQARITQSIWPAGGTKAKGAIIIELNQIWRKTAPWEHGKAGACQNCFALFLYFGQKCPQAKTRP